MVLLSCVITGRIWKVQIIIITWQCVNLNYKKSPHTLLLPLDCQSWLFVSSRGSVEVNDSMASFDAGSSSSNKEGFASSEKDMVGLQYWVYTHHQEHLFSLKVDSILSNQEISSFISNLNLTAVTFAKIFHLKWGGEPAQVLASMWWYFICDQVSKDELSTVCI